MSVISLPVIPGDRVFRTDNYRRYGILKPGLSESNCTITGVQALSRDDSAEVIFMYVGIRLHSTVKAQPRNSSNMIGFTEAEVREL